MKAQKRQAQPAQGPSLYEVELLRQLKEELEVFLHSKSLATIQAFDIAFAGKDYKGLVRVRA